MARNRQIGRSEVAARVAPPSVAQQTASYRAMLDTDLGKPNFRYTPPDDGQPLGFVALFARPAGLFILAVIAFLSVLGVKLWRDGMFDRLWAPRSAVVERGGIRFDPATRMLPPVEAEAAPEITAPKTVDTDKAASKPEAEPDEEEVFEAEAAE